ATEVVGQGQLAGAGNRYQVAVQTLDVLEVVQTHGAAVLDLDAVGRRGPAGRATDVARTHGQLGTRLTDRLGSDNADRLTDVDLMPAGQIAAVALGADAVAGFTADRRAHDDFVDAVDFDEVDPAFVNQGAGRNQHFFGA